MLLPVEIARFTRTEPARLCCSDPRLTAGRRYLLRRPLESGLSSCKASCPRSAVRLQRAGLYAFFLRTATRFSFSATPSFQSALHRQKALAQCLILSFDFFREPLKKKAKSQTFLYHQRSKYNLNSRTSRSAAVTIDSLSSVLHASVFFVMPRTFYYL